MLRYMLVNRDFRNPINTKKYVCYFTLKRLVVFDFQFLKLFLFLKNHAISFVHARVSSALDIFL